MSNRRLRFFLMIVALAAAGAAIGRISGPWLAKMNYIVQVAEQVWLEEARGAREQTLQTQAVQRLGVPKDQLMRDAREIRAKFLIGGTLFGLWCGLVIGFKIVSVLNEPRRKEYETDRAHCVACGRCFLSCPVEHERLKGRTI